MAARRETLSPHRRRINRTTSAITLLLVGACVAGCDSETAPEALRVDFVRALGRLRGFLAENADIVYGLALEDREVAVIRRAAGA